MKIFIVVFYCLLVGTARAEEGLVIRNSTQGHFYMGFEYLNISFKRTDTNFYLLADSGEFDESISQEENKRSDLYGWGFGYSRTFDSNIGYRLGAIYVVPINGNNQSDIQGVRMLIPEVNLTFALNPSLAVYTGFNYGLMVGFPQASKWKSNVGGQIGMQLQISEQCSVGAGYLVLRSVYSEYDSYTGGPLHQTQSEIRLTDGFNLSLAFSF